jgi:hypothetical protein
MDAVLNFVNHASVFHALTEHYSGQSVKEQRHGKPTESPIAGFATPRPIAG